MRALSWVLAVLLSARCAAPAQVPPQLPEPEPTTQPGPRVQTTGVLSTQEPERPVIPPQPAAVAAASTITSDLMHGHIAWLASDELRGRDTPSLGLELAAQYIAEEFRSLGLEPAGDNIDYIQRWTLRSARTSTESRPPNVAAVLRGSDPELRETYVVFTAHFDHLGVGRPDASRDSIYNGADDNASGTAAVLAIARAFAALEQRPARSVLFLGVSGEEDGLYGSEDFVLRGAVALPQIVAELNIDMIGRNPDGFVAAIGLGYSSLGPLAQDAARANADLRIRAVDDPWPAERLFFRSDHYNFARRGVPSLFFTTGPHADYHRPSDSVEKIDTDKAARIARLVFHVGYLVASDAERPEWTERGRREVLGTAGTDRGEVETGRGSEGRADRMRGSRSPPHPGSKGGGR